MKLSVIVLLLLIYYLHSKSKITNKMISVRSTIDQKYYTIIKSKNKNDDIGKANILAKINFKIQTLISSLSMSNSKQLLKEASIKLEERTDKTYIAYTVNKGDSIGLCIENDENTLFFIVLHELAHVITKEKGHTETFWKNFEFLVKQAIKMKLYDYSNYNKTPVTYCKKEISYSPNIVSK